MTLETLHKAFLASAGISTDTRRDVRDTLFVALKGEQFDGNRFVSDALEKGCRLAITEDRELDGDSRVVCVTSSLELLQQLANFHRHYVAPKVLAITGSNGKTTTKELVKAVLAKGFEVLATHGNLNNHIGVPLTLLTLEKEELAVIEMGANHPGEIGKLAEIAAPELGMITNVGKAHLEGFGSLDGVLNAKTELYQYLASVNGQAIIDGQDSILSQRATEIGVQSLRVGANLELQVTGKIIRQSPFLEVELQVEDAVSMLSTRMVGAYNLQNILLATATGLHFGIPTDSIAEAIIEYMPENQRSQFIEGARNRVMLDSYNANPSSMREAINGIIAFASSPIMLILGDMAELGDTSLEEHRRLIKWIDTLSVDRFILVGPLFSEAVELPERLTVFRDRVELEAYLETQPPEGYQILVKGSRVMELEKVLKFLV